MPRTEQALIIQNLTPGLVERGKIKIGRKGNWNEKHTFQMPVRLDHFLITTLERDKDNNLLPDVEAMNLLGEKPKRIPIILLYDSIDMNFQCRYACFKRAEKRLIRWCVGDGKTATRIGEGNNHTTEACPCDRCEPLYEGNDICKTCGVLSCMIQGMPGVGGVYKFRTAGRNSVVNILSSLTLIHTLTGGRTKGIPLDMVVSPKSTVIPKTGAPTTVQVVSVEFNGVIDALMEIGYQAALNEAKYNVNMERIEDTARKLISVDDAVIGDSTQDYGDEFAPPEAELQGPVDESATGAAETEPETAVRTETEPETASTTVTGAAPGAPKRNSVTVEPITDAPAAPIEGKATTKAPPVSTDIPPPVEPETATVQPEQTTLLPPAQDGGKLTDDLFGEI